MPDGTFQLGDTATQPPQPKQVDEGLVNLDYTNIQKAGAILPQRPDYYINDLKNGGTQFIKDIQASKAPAYYKQMTQDVYTKNVQQVPKQTPEHDWFRQNLPLIHQEYEKQEKEKHEDFLHKQGVMFKGKPTDVDVPNKKVSYFTDELQKAQNPPAGDVNFIGQAIIDAGNKAERPNLDKTVDLIHQYYNNELKKNGYSDNKEIEKDSADLRKQIQEVLPGWYPQTTPKEWKALDDNSDYFYSDIGSNINSLEKNQPGFLESAGNDIKDIGRFFGNMSSAMAGQGIDLTPNPEDPESKLKSYQSLKRSYAQEWLLGQKPKKEDESNWDVFADNIIKSGINDEYQTINERITNRDNLLNTAFSKQIQKDDPNLDPTEVGKQADLKTKELTNQFESGVVNGDFMPTLSTTAGGLVGVLPSFAAYSAAGNELAGLSKFTSGLSESTNAITRMASRMTKFGLGEATPWIATDPKHPIKDVAMAGAFHGAGIMANKLGGALDNKYSNGTFKVLMKATATAGIHGTTAAAVTSAMKYASILAGNSQDFENELDKEGAGGVFSRDAKEFLGNSLTYSILPFRGIYDHFRMTNYLKAFREAAVRDAANAPKDKHKAADKIVNDAETNINTPPSPAVEPIVQSIKTNPTPDRPVHATLKEKSDFAVPRGKNEFLGTQEDFAQQVTNGSNYMNFVDGGVEAYTGKKAKQIQNLRVIEAKEGLNPKQIELLAGLTEQDKEAALRAVMAKAEGKNTVLYDAIKTHLDQIELNKEGTADENGMKQLFRNHLQALQRNVPSSREVNETKQRITDFAAAKGFIIDDDGSGGMNATKGDKVISMSGDLEFERTKEKAKNLQAKITEQSKKTVDKRNTAQLRKDALAEGLYLATDDEGNIILKDGEAPEANVIMRPDMNYKGMKDIKGDKELIKGINKAIPLLKKNPQALGEMKPEDVLNAVNQIESGDTTPTWEVQQFIEEMKKTPDIGGGKPIKEEPPTLDDTKETVKDSKIKTWKKAGMPTPAKPKFTGEKEYTNPSYIKYLMSLPKEDAIKEILSGVSTLWKKSTDTEHYEDETVKPFNPEKPYEYQPKSRVVPSVKIELPGVFFGSPNSPDKIMQPFVAPIPFHITGEEGAYKVIDYANGESHNFSTLDEAKKKVIGMYYDNIKDVYDNFKKYGEHFAGQTAQTIGKKLISEQAPRTAADIKALQEKRKLMSLDNSTRAERDTLDREIAALKEKESPKERTIEDIDDEIYSETHDRDKEGRPRLMPEREVDTEKVKSLRKERKDLIRKGEPKKKQATPKAAETKEKTIEDYEKDIKEARNALGAHLGRGNTKTDPKGKRLANDLQNAIDAKNTAINIAEKGGEAIPEQAEETREQIANYSKLNTAYKTGNLREINKAIESLGLDKGMELFIKGKGLNFNSQVKELLKLKKISIVSANALNITIGNKAIEDVKKKRTGGKLDSGVLQSTILPFDLTGKDDQPSLGGWIHNGLTNAIKTFNKGTKFKDFHKNIKAIYPKEQRAELEALRKRGDLNDEDKRMLDELESFDRYLKGRQVQYAFNFLHHWAHGSLNDILGVQEMGQIDYKAGDEHVIAANNFFQQAIVSGRDISKGDPAQFRDYMIAKAADIRSKGVGTPAENPNNIIASKLLSLALNANSKARIDKAADIATNSVRYKFGDMITSPHYIYDMEVAEQIGKEPPQILTPEEVTNLKEILGTLDPDEELGLQVKTRHESETKLGKIGRGLSDLLLHPQWIRNVATSEYDKKMCDKIYSEVQRHLIQTPQTLMHDWSAKTMDAVKDLNNDQNEMLSKLAHYSKYWNEKYLTPEQMREGILLPNRRDYLRPDESTIKAYNKVVDIVKDVQDKRIENEKNYRAQAIPKPVLDDAGKPVLDANGNPKTEKHDVWHKDMTPEQQKKWDTDKREELFGVGGYFPFDRQKSENYYVVGTGSDYTYNPIKKDGTQYEPVKHYFKFKTEAEAEKRYRELNKAGFTGLSYGKNKDVTRDALKGVSVDQIYAVKEAILKGRPESELTGTEKNYIESLNGVIRDALVSRGQGNKLAFKATPGIDPSYENFRYSLAGMINREANANGAMASKYNFEQLLPMVRDNKTANMLTRWHKSINSAGEGGNFIKYAAPIAYAWRLAASPIHVGRVFASSMYMPALALHLEDSPVMANYPEAWAKAMGFGLAFTRDKQGMITEQFRKWDKTKGVKFLDPSRIKERGMYKEMESLDNAGLFGNTEMTQTLYGVNNSALDKLSNKVDFNRLMNQSICNVEYFNRVLTAHLALQHCDMKGITDPVERQEFASKMVFRANSNYDKTNQLLIRSHAMPSPVLKGLVGSMLLFKNTHMNHNELMTQVFGDACQALITGHNAQKAIGRLVVAGAWEAGGMGIDAFTKPVDFAMRALPSISVGLQKHPYSTAALMAAVAGGYAALTHQKGQPQTTLLEAFESQSFIHNHPEIAEALAHGWTSLFGIDGSNMFDLGTTRIGGTSQGQTWMDATAPTAILHNIMKGFEKFVEGAPAQGLRYVSPNFVSNPAKALEWNKSPLQIEKGVTFKPNRVQQAEVAMGFQPIPMNEGYKIKDLETDFSGYRTSYLNHIKNTGISQDDKIDKYNQGVQGRIYDMYEDSKLDIDEDKLISLMKRYSITPEDISKAQDEYSQK